MCESAGVGGDVDVMERRGHRAKRRRLSGANSVIDLAQALACGVNPSDKSHSSSGDRHLREFSLSDEPQI
jgi:hypothetical protein